MTSSWKKSVSDPTLTQIYPEHTYE